VVSTAAARQDPERADARTGACFDTSSPCPSPSPSPSSAHSHGPIPPSSWSATFASAACLRARLSQTSWPESAPRRRSCPSCGPTLAKWGSARSMWPNTGCWYGSGPTSTSTRTRQSTWSTGCARCWRDRPSGFVGEDVADWTFWSCRRRSPSSFSPNAVSRDMSLVRRVRSKLVSRLPLSRPGGAGRCDRLKRPSSRGVKWRCGAVLFIIRYVKRDGWIVGPNRRSNRRAPGPVEQGGTRTLAIQTRSQLSVASQGRRKTDGGMETTETCVLKDDDRTSSGRHRYENVPGVMKD
jgi:hypothetical protein